MDDFLIDDGDSGDLDGLHRREACFEGTYTCDCCGEEIVIPLDPSTGSSQNYVEDCPVCCHPHVIDVDWHDGIPRVNAQPEQDRY
ncbi:MAG: CPXCG motif-containing cysteine-rich protein [Planctomycetota bacterium]